MSTSELADGISEDVGQAMNPDRMLADALPAGTEPSRQDVRPSLPAVPGLGIMQREKPSLNEDSANFIHAGDLVIAFLSRDRPPIPVTVTPGLFLDTAYGKFAHGHMVGMPFGAKLSSVNKRGFIHLLRPSPELWTLALPHRTQILYSPDMSFIAAHLGLSPGACVIEAGTGSGSFSHYAVRCVARKHPQASGRGWRGPIGAKVKAEGVRGEKKVSGAQRRREKKRKQANAKNGNTVSSESDSDSSGDNDNESDIDAQHASGDELVNMAPEDEREARILHQLASLPDANTGDRDGRVWSFEFHAGRAMKAWLEFEEHGLFPTLSLRHRNVCKVGFGLENVADAVFLDLPAPWQALHHAAAAMRRDRATRICCFSPCIEQVIKTVAALRRGRDEEDAAAQDGVTDMAAARSENQRAPWTDIETYEVLQRTYVSTTVITPTIDDAIERIKVTDEKKGRRRERQIERTRREREARERGDEGAIVNTDQGSSALSAVSGEKRKRESEDAMRQASDDVDARDLARPSPNGSGQAKADRGSIEEERTTRAPSAPAQGDGSNMQDARTHQPAKIYSMPFPEMRGHTSYLTFATLAPRVVTQEADPILARERAQQQHKALMAERQRQRAEAKRLALEADKGVNDASVNQSEETISSERGVGHEASGDDS